MVYAANGAFALDGMVLPARFAYAERAPEAAAHADWHRRNGTGYAGPAIAEPAATNEAEGDFAVLPTGSSPATGSAPAARRTASWPR